MHEAAFARAALSQPITVLGFPLRPYSLGHELWLLRQANLLLNFAGSARGLEPALLEAVLITSQSFAENCAMNRDRLIGLKLKLWRFRVRKILRNPDRFDRHLGAFLQYLADGSLEFPDERPDGAKPGRTPGSPFLLRLHQFLMLKLAKTETEAWDYPLGLAKMQMAAFYENEGLVNVWNEDDYEVERQFQEWEKKNPGPGIVKQKEKPHA